MIITLSYELEIKGASIHYRFLLLKKVVYAKEIEPSNIQKVIFKHAGWGRPGAYIKTKRGFNLRILFFSPIEVMEELQSYVNHYSIDWEEKKDFQVAYELKKRNEKREA